MADHQYLSIGEVLGLLLEDFPDVTISKIRFLESQGLIEPERTPSGYRKFYDNDVELLRAILHEQKANFLPLKVIRDRIESGAIDSDSTGGRTPPRGIRNVETRPTSETRAAAGDSRGVDSTDLAATRDSVFRRTDGGPEWADGQALIPGSGGPVPDDLVAPQHGSGLPITAAVPVIPLAPTSQSTSHSTSSPRSSSESAPASATTTRPAAPPKLISEQMPDTQPPVSAAVGPTQEHAPKPLAETSALPTAVSQAAERPPTGSARPPAAGTVIAALIEPPPPPNRPARPEANDPAATSASSASSGSSDSPVNTGSARDLPYNALELCAAASITMTQLAALQEYGIVTARGSGADVTYRPQSVEIARICGLLLAEGIDARHLRAWRQSAERESALFEQRIMPLMRQRNPQARHAALASLSELSALGSSLHNALVESLLRHHFDGS